MSRRLHVASRLTMKGYCLGGDTQRLATHDLQKIYDKQSWPELYSRNCSIYVAPIDIETDSKVIGDFQVLAAAHNKAQSYHNTLTPWQILRNFRTKYLNFTKTTPDAKKSAIDEILRSVDPGMLGPCLSILNDLGGKSGPAVSHYRQLCKQPEKVWNVIEQLFETGTVNGVTFYTGGMQKKITLPLLNNGTDLI